MEDEVEDIFDPSKGNVVFGCAFDGWAFRLQQFAEMYAKMLGASASALVQGLWGDFFYHPKTKTVSKGRIGAIGKGKPMFVQFILEPIWNVSILPNIVDSIVLRIHLVLHRIKDERSEFDCSHRSGRSIDTG